MSFKFKSDLVSEEKYSIKCPYPMAAEFVVIHNTANDASAQNEIRYMKSNNEKVSYHYAVDDEEVICGVAPNRNAWHAGDGLNGGGNRKGIGIEICYSKSGGERYRKAEENAAEFVSELLKHKKWGIEQVKKHQDFSGKRCPHRILGEGRWQEFLNRIESNMKGDLTVDQYDELNAKIEKIQEKINVGVSEPSGWAKEIWEAATATGVTDGTNPRGFITREQAAAMILRAVGR